MNKKRALGGLKRLAAAEIILVVSAIMMTVSDFMMADFDLARAKATMSGDPLDGPARFPVLIAFFALIFIIAASVTKLVGVCKVSREFRSARGAIAPAAGILAASLVVFYLDAADVESMNPTLSAAVKLISGLLLIVFYLFALRGLSDAAKGDSSEKTLRLIKKLRLPILIFSVVALASISIIGFVGKKTLGLAAYEALLCVRTAFESGTYILSAVVSLSAAGAVRSASE